MAKIYATGRRKASIAKVWLTPGTGQMTINGLSLDAWLGGLEAKKLRVFLLQVHPTMRLVKDH